MPSTYPLTLEMSLNMLAPSFYHRTKKLSPMIVSRIIRRTKSYCNYPFEGVYKTRRKEKGFSAELYLLFDSILPQLFLLGRTQKQRHPIHPS
jgi:hypothetical protein